MGFHRVFWRLPSLVVVLALFGMQCDDFFIAGLVQLSGPAPGSTLTEPGRATFEVVLAEELADTGIEAVEFYHNGQPACADEAGPPWTCTWEYTAADNGEHEFIARVMHETGPGARSNPLSFTVAIDGNATRSNPTATGLVGFVPEIGAANDLVLDGNTAYAASEEFGLTTLDVSHPDTPMVLGSADVPFVGRHVAVRNGRAVVTGVDANGKAHLWVLDVSSPGAPQLTGELSTAITPGATAGFLGVELNSAGTVAVTAMGTAGIWTLDVSNTESPQHVGTYDTPGTARAVALGAGNMAFVADHGSAEDLLVVNVSNAGSPTRAGGLGLYGLVTDIAVEGARAYLTNQTGRIQVVDVGAPSAPVQLGVAATTGSPRRISVSENTALVLTGSGSSEVFQVFELSSDNPISRSTTTVGPVGVTTSMVIDGTTAYFGARVLEFDNPFLSSQGESGLKVWDLASLSSPVLETTIVIPFAPRALSESGNLVAIAGGDRITGKGVLRLIDTTTADEPAVIGELGTTANTGAAAGFLGVALDTAHDLAVTAMGTAGVWTVDVSNPAHPVKLGEVDTPGTAYKVTLSADATIAYVADHTGDVQIIDISNRAAPRIEGKVNPLFGLVTDVAVSGDMLYVANQSGRLQVIDVSNAAQPVLIGIQAIVGSAFHIAVEGDIAAVLTVDTSNDWLHLLDISNPALPSLVESVDIGPSGVGTGVAFMDGNIAVAGDGLSIYNAQTGALLDTVVTVGHAQGVAASGSLAFVASMPGTVSVVHLP